MSSNVSRKVHAAIVAAALALTSGGILITQSAGPLLGYDAVTVGNVPLGAHVVGCYTSGPFANCSAMRAREPHARLVEIATNASSAGRILDTETGDAQPWQDAGWIKWMIRRGIFEPGIYANASTMPTVRADLVASGLRRSQYVLWVAQWNGDSAVPSGYDAHQYRSTSLLDYDSFNRSFFRAPPPRIVCFGRHATGSATCRRVHAEVRVLLAKESSQRRAEATNARISRMRSCPVLSQRERWFATQLHRHPRSRRAARWHRALHSSRVAFRRRLCWRWMHRQTYFARAAAQTLSRERALVRKYS